MSTVLAAMPDDVDTVVDAFEKFSPMIEASVQDTAAQALFDEYGPAFALVTLNEPIRPGDAAANNRLQLRMHGIFVGELQALEGAGRSLWDFPDAPWEFKMNMARQCWDEQRHVQIYEKLLEHIGGEVGMFPESTFLFECACSDDPAMRVAGVNRGTRRPRVRRLPGHDPLRREDRRREDAPGCRLRAGRRTHPRALRQRVGQGVHERRPRPLQDGPRTTARRSTSSSASAAPARTARTPRSRSPGKTARKRASPRRSCANWPRPPSRGRPRRR